MIPILFLITLFLYTHTIQTSATAALTHAPDESEQKCGICLSDIDSEEEEPLNAFECTHDEHSFHNKCISELFEHTPGAPCPICRAKKAAPKPKAEVAETPFDKIALLALDFIERHDREKSNRTSPHRENANHREDRKKRSSQSPQYPKAHDRRDRYNSFVVNEDELAAFRIG